jgi:uncharacterized protein YndB with AHSA1/START domain
MQRREFLLAAGAAALSIGSTKGASEMVALVTHDVVVTRTFSATPERVWAAWTEDTEVMKWWGPKPWACPEARMDVREDAASIVSMKSPEGFEIWMR